MLHELQVTPEVFNKETDETLRMMFKKLSIEERQAQINSIYGYSAWFVNSDSGVRLELNGDTAFQLHQKGGFTTGEMLTQNFGEEWEGVGKYRIVAGNCSYFECTAGKVEAVHDVEDTTQNGETVAITVIENYLLVAGALLSTFNVAKMNEHIRNIIKGGKVSEYELEGFRDLVYPYIYLVPNMESD